MNEDRKPTHALTGEEVLGMTRTELEGRFFELQRLFKATNDNLTAVQELCTTQELRLRDARYLQAFETESGIARTDASFWSGVQVAREIVRQRAQSPGRPTLTEIVTEALALLGMDVDSDKAETAARDKAMRVAAMAARIHAEGVR